MHFDRILLNVDLYDRDFLFTVSVNVLCSHVTYRKELKWPLSFPPLADTCYAKKKKKSSTKITAREQLEVFICAFLF